MLNKDERPPFWEDLALVAVPAIIAIIPDLLQLFCGSESKTRKKEGRTSKEDTPKEDTPKAESFSAYVRLRSSGEH